MRTAAAATAVSFSVLLFLELPPENFPGGGLGQRLDEFDEARRLEGGHFLPRPADDRVRLGPAARRRLEHHHRLDGLAAVRVLRRDDAGFLDVGVRVEHGLDLGRPDLVARAVDHSLEAIGDEEVAFFVVVAEVARAKEALAVMLEESLGGGFFLLPVAAKDLRAVDDDLAHLVWPKLLEARSVDDAR